MREFPSPLKTLITLDLNKPIEAQERIIVSEAIFKKITSLEESDGYAAVVDMPEPTADLSQTKRLLILDQIADPGNLGTLLRTAFAFGWDGVIATPGTVDFFNDKALRAAKGATFRLPYCWRPPEEIAFLLKVENRQAFLADMKGTPLGQGPFSPPLALILSHEAKGIRSWAEELTSQSHAADRLAKKIALPMERGAESLNVASAGAIFLYTMRRSL